LLGRRHLLPADQPGGARRYGWRPRPRRAPCRTAPTSAGTAKTGTAGDETSRIAGLFKGDNLALVLASFFGFGLLLSLTPCVFPMIPILSGIIVNHGHAVSHLRAFILSLAYVLGMAVTYAIVGVAAGLVRHPAVGGLAERLGAHRLRPGLRRAVAVDVRLLRIATSRRAAKQGIRHGEQAGAARCRPLP
jgi:hypothetical protein